MFFFRTPKVTVDLFTANASAFEFGKPQPAVKMHPDWWKRLKRPADVGHKNMRYCPGYVELYKRGFMTTLWSDVKIFVTGTRAPDAGWGYEFADEVSVLEAHDNKQFDGFYSPDKCVAIKIHSPWKASTRTSLDFLVVDAAYNRMTHNLYFCPTGYVNFVDQHETNPFLFFIRNETDTNITLEFGTPLNHFVPLSDKRVELAYHLVSNEEMSRLTPKGITFFGDYYKQLKVKRMFK